MYSYNAQFKNVISNLHAEGRYRVFRTIDRCPGQFPEATWHHKGEARNITVWCGNDYLGMGQHPAVMAAAHEAIDNFGAGSGGTRNISGNHSAIVDLEIALAEATGKGGALVFSSGYNANETALSALGRILPECIFVSDAANHASMIEGMRLSGAEKHIFRHNDVEHLKSILSKLPPGRPKVVAFESVYSMEGDTSPIAEICAVAREYNALTYLDETHAVGIYGHSGGGIAQARGLTEEVDILQGGLGKGYGVVGGFIASSATIVDAIRSVGSGFIFTTSIPPSVARAACASVRWLQSSSVEREQHQNVVAVTKQKLKAAGVDFRDGGTHIIPVMIGDSRRCKEIADFLLEEKGIYLQPINYPTVPRGTERLRVTPSPFHKAEDIHKLATSFQEAFAVICASEARAA